MCGLSLKKLCEIGHAKTVRLGCQTFVFFMYLIFPLFLGKAERERLLLGSHSGGGGLCGHVHHVRDPQAGDHLQVGALFSNCIHT